MTQGFYSVQIFGDTEPHIADSVAHEFCTVQIIVYRCTNKYLVQKIDSLHLP